MYIYLFLNYDLYIVFEIIYTNSNGGKKIQIHSNSNEVIHTSIYKYMGCNKTVQLKTRKMYMPAKAWR